MCCLTRRLILLFSPNTGPLSLQSASKVTITQKTNNNWHDRSLIKVIAPRWRISQPSFIMKKNHKFCSKHNRKIHYRWNPVHIFLQYLFIKNTHCIKRSKIQNSDHCQPPAGAIFHNRQKNCRPFQ
mgnify:CR=1 FL=1